MVSSVVIAREDVLDNSVNIVETEREIKEPQLCLPLSVYLQNRGGKGVSNYFRLAHDDPRLANVVTANHVTKVEEVMDYRTYCCASVKDLVQKPNWDFLLKHGLIRNVKWNYQEGCRFRDCVPSLLAARNPN